MYNILANQERFVFAADRDKLSTSKNKMYLKLLTKKRHNEINLCFQAYKLDFKNLKFNVVKINKC